MNESKYNFYFTHLGMVWIYNNFSKKIIKVEPLVAEKLKKESLNLLKVKTPLEFEELFCNGMICEDGDKETENYINNLGKDKKKSKLEFTILASTDCNFKCQYCYEQFAPQTIDHQFIEKFLLYIEKNISYYSSVFVDWFGGEPLLAKNQILMISSELKTICRKNKKSYLSSITTNGYDLDYDSFVELLNQNILFYQVTIDGNKKTHDKYRPLKNGKGTYERIIKNLIDIKLHAPSYRTFRIVIRNNVSKRNQKECEEFSIWFNDFFGEDKRFQLFQFPIKDWGGHRIEKMKEDLFQEIEPLNQDRNNIFESVEASCCVASKKNGFVISPDLRVYKCHHYLQNTLKYKNEIGYINDKGDLVIDEETNDKWLSPIISPECRACKFLPNCITMCPLHDLIPYQGCVEGKKRQLERQVKEYIEDNSEKR